MKSYLALAAAAGFVPALAFGQTPAYTQPMGPVQGDREVILSGSGSSDVDFDNNTVNVNGSFAQYLTDATALGLRQGVTFIDRPNVSSQWRGATDLFAQWHFGGRDAAVRPFVGANVGYFYGDGITDTWVAGPEVGAKWYVRPHTFVLTQVDYQVTFRSSDDVDEDWDDGRFNYRLGVGYNF